MIRDIIQMSYLIVVADITLILFISFNSALPRKKKLQFLLAAGIAAVMVMCNILTSYAKAQGQHSIISKVAMGLSYSLSGPVILPVIFLSSVIKPKIRIVLQAAASVNIILCMASISTGWVFRLTADGGIELGLFSPVPFYLSAMYLAVLIAASFMKYRLGFRGESIFLAFLSLGVLSAVVLNTAYGFQFLVSGMAVLSSIFYYLFFTVQTLTRDALTNARNRHSFYKDVEGMKRHHMYLVSMDLNGLKQINDTQGHDAGDRAILAVSECVFECLLSGCRFYRMGGDEFEIICPDISRHDVIVLLKKIKTAVEARSHSVAMGFAEYHRGMDFDKVFKEADAMMYDNKQKMKAGIADEEE